MDRASALIMRVLASHGVDLWGICAFADLLPLLEVGRRRRIPPEARSVVVCAFPYRAAEWEERNLCRYAVADDYHGIVGGILGELAAALEKAYPGTACAAFVDNSPVREVAAALDCGLGARGRHNLLITGAYGSWVHLGSLVTTLPLPPRRREAPARCLDCGACAAACPVGALSPAGFRRARCRSAITQKRGALTPWEAEQVRAGGLAWGCDLCQEACPLNADKPLSPIPAFGRNPLPLLTPAALPAALETKAYGYRGRAVLERNLRLIGGPANHNT